MERGWLVPIEQVPPNLKTGNIHQNCNRKIDNHVVLAKKRCKEDRERMVCSLRASPTYFEYWKNPPKSKINDIVWIEWLKIMLWDGKKEARRIWRVGNWLLSSKSHLLRIQEKSTKIKDQEYCNQMVENHVLLANKRWNEDGERAVGSLQVQVPVPVLTPFQFEYRKNPRNQRSRVL